MKENIVVQLLKMGIELQKNDIKLLEEQNLLNTTPKELCRLKTGLFLFGFSKEALDDIARICQKPEKEPKSKIKETFEASDIEINSTADYIVIVPNGTKTIAKRCFLGRYVKEVRLPSSLRNISYEAFRNIPVSNIDFSEGLKLVGYGAFRSSRLQCAVLPSTVDTIGRMAFYDSKSLVTVSTSARVINPAAFSYCSSLFNLILKDGIEEIGASAFSSCKALQYVTIPDTVKSIGIYAFSLCEQLTKVKLSANLKVIPSGAFSNSGVSSINVPEGVETIEKFAFFGCHKLTSIKIPRSVRTIENNVFDSCTGLNAIYISDSLPELSVRTLPQDILVRY